MAFSKLYFWLSENQTKGGTCIFHWYVFSLRRIIMGQNGSNGQLKSKIFLGASLHWCASKWSPGWKLSSPCRIQEIIFAGTEAFCLGKVSVYLYSTSVFILNTGVQGLFKCLAMSHLTHLMLEKGTSSLLLLCHIYQYDNIYLFNIHKIIRQLGLINPNKLESCYIRVLCQKVEVYFRLNERAWCSQFLGTCKSFASVLYVRSILWRRLLCQNIEFLGNI